MRLRISPFLEKRRRSWGLRRDSDELNVTQCDEGRILWTLFFAHERSSKIGSAGPLSISIWQWPCCSFSLVSVQRSLLNPSSSATLHYRPVRLPYGSPRTADISQSTALKRSSFTFQQSPPLRH